MFLNRTAPAFSIGNEALCLLPVDGSPADLKLLMKDLGIGRQAELRDLATIAAGKAGIRIHFGNSEDGGREIYANVQSLDRLKYHAGRYWADVYGNRA